VNHDFTPRIGMSFAWVYGTGNAITLSTYRFQTVDRDEEYVYSNTIESGGKRNAFRMTDYHRLDFSIEFRKQKKKWERKWVVGVYNTYWHRNPYFMYADTRSVQQPDGSFKNERVFREVSLLPLIPSVSYQFKF